MRALVGIILVSSGLSGCFDMPVVSQGKVSTLDEAPRLAASVSKTDSKAIAAYDPNSKVATTVAAPSGALAGSSVTFPAGSLALAAELVVEEAVPLSQTSVASSLSISSEITVKPVGAGLIIRPTENVDLTKPLTIAMPINPTAGLSGWLAQVLALNSSKYYTVFYKYFQDGELKAGAIPSSSLRISDSGSVLFEGYFGAYWLAEVSAPIQKKLEVRTEEPIVNKQNVAVVTNTGMVTESVILTKAAIPAVEWTSVTLVLDDVKRMVTAKASIKAGRTLSACRVDLFETTGSTSGINLDIGSTLSTGYQVIKKEAHKLFARFRCIDDQERMAISYWSAAVSIPGEVAAKPVSDFCGATPPELRLFMGSGTSVLSNAQAFQAQGSCLYKLDVDTLGDFTIGIQTADGKVSCSAAAVKTGEQTLVCGPSSGMPPAMALPQGNYTFKLDFAASASSPKLSVELQSCTLGDLHIVTGDSMNNVWSTPDATNRMKHLGGCQYSLQTTRSDPYDYSNQLRIQNANGTYVCGESFWIQPGVPGLISCGAPTGRSYWRYHSNPGVTGHRYLVNLGSNLEPGGKPTSSAYLYYTEVDTCNQDLYLLGITSAGNNRIPGVNQFKEPHSCYFHYAWSPGTASPAPFYIGVGNGTEKCGISSSPATDSNVTLDCSATALPIDMQNLGFGPGSFFVSVSSDFTTGKPTSLHVGTTSDTCHQSFYALGKSAPGYFQDIQKVMTEVSECVYEYDWTPTATDRNLTFIQGTNYPYICAAYLGYSQPVVGGPPVNIGCYYSNDNGSLKQEHPVTPTGIIDGQRYKVTLDLRLRYFVSPKISIARHTATSCPDLYVTGISGSNFPDASNKMTRIGDCNYAFNFRSAPFSTHRNFRITDASGSTQCGLDSATGSTHPHTGGYTAPLACSAGTAADFTAYFDSSMYYQVLVHYKSSGNSRISLNQFESYYCYPSTLDGPAAMYQHASYSSTFKMVDGCVEELLWVPTATASSFNLKWDNYNYASYCGSIGSSTSLSLSGVESNATCNIFNASKVNNFSVSNGVNTSTKYLLRLDRSVPYNPPKISINPVSESFPNPIGAYVNGSGMTNVSNSTSYPGGRDNAAVWQNPVTQYKYMFGGLGIANDGSTSYLADLWRFDSVNNTWSLLPTNDLGTSNGFIATTGSFHPANRPSGRHGAVALFDPSGSGKLWLFGGEGFSTSMVGGVLNDLWVYDLGLNQWALMSGTMDDVNVAGDMGTPGVASHDNGPGGRHMASGWINSSGKIYIFGGNGFADVTSPYSIGFLNDLWLFDPSTSYANNTWTYLNGGNSIDHAGSNTYPASRGSSVAWKDAAGNFWLFGGHGISANPQSGPIEGKLADLWSFNPGNGLWTRRGGPEIADAPGILGLRGVRSKRVWPPARSSAAGWQAADGKFWLFGGYGQTSGSSYAGYVNSGSSGHLNDVWSYDPVSMQWAWVSGFTHYWFNFEVLSAERYGQYGPVGDFGSYQPGSRSAASVWPDLANPGNVWLFGGNGFGDPYSNSGSGSLNDLWYLDF